MQRISVTVLCIMCLLFVANCENSMYVDHSIDTILEGTWWKLEGIVNTVTGVTKVLEPRDCANCYTIMFHTDTTFFGRSSTNAVFGTYSANYKTHNMCITDFGGSKMGEIGDGHLFWNHDVWLTVQAFSFKKNTLKLYFDNKKKYLLFKSFEQ